MINVNNNLKNINDLNNNNNNNNINRLNDNNNNNLNINTFIGIDVGKFYIDVYNSLTGEYYLKIKNDEQSIKKLITQIKKSFKFYNDKNKTSLNTKHTLVIIDLTGDYEVLCRDTFYNNGFTNIHLADGKKILYFKKSKKNSILKTDKSDAQILAIYGKENLYDLINNNNLYTKDINEEDLINLQKIELRINDLKDILVKEKNRYQAPNIPKIIKKDIKSSIELLEKKIEKLEIESTKIIERNKNLKKKYTILINQKGIGNKTAKTLISFLPELGNKYTNRNTISAITGTAPIPKDSGTIKGYRTTKGTGRTIIKKALFIIILSKIREQNSYLYNFYNKLLKKGKKKKVGIIACMRKFIIYLNGILKKEELAENM